MNEQNEMQGDKSAGIATFFAPPERQAPEELADMRAFVEENPLFRAICESIDGYLLILNPQRQILAVNRQMLDDLKIETPSCLVGARPGEVLNCVHVPNGPGGCGTSKACSTCGAVISILTSQQEGKPSTNECLATVRQNNHTEALEFRVRSTPIRIGGNEFTVMVLNDISGDKRREALERTFFHDILNTVGGLMGWGGLLEAIDGLDPKEAAGRIVELSKRLHREIEDQRRLLAAERGTLEISNETVSVQQIFGTLKTVFAVHDASKGKQLEVGDVNPEETVTTDSSLLVRVLTNMVKNAFEAIQLGETVRVSFEKRNGDAVFSVQNPGCIPEEVALRIFQRSFSTKAKAGRGIGTYSMKMFGERYLGGKVGFETSEEQGTRFFIQLPV